MFFRVLISFFILSISHTVYGQEIIDAFEFWPDYKAFQVQPEYNLFPSSSPEIVEIPSHGLYLDFDLLIVDSLYLIDTMYYYNNLKKREKYKNYRRIFYYDEQSRISSVLAEDLIGDQWRAHQKTELSYMHKGKLSNIYYTRYDTLLTQAEITYTYDNNNLVLKEIIEKKFENEDNCCSTEIKNYFYDDGKIIFVDYSKSKNNFPIGRVKYKYKNGKLVEVILYQFKDNTIIPHLKTISEFNDDNQLLLKYDYFWKESSWQLESRDRFEYDEDGKLVEINDSVSPYYKMEFLYDNKNRIADILSYRKTIRDSLSTTLYKTYKKYEYNKSGKLISYTNQWEKINQGDSIADKFRVLVERDEFQNVTSIIKEKWFQENWLEEDRMRVTYKRK